MKEGIAGDVVELADKSIGFTDPDTGLDISRDNQVELTDPVGKRTQAAIASGALLIVKEAARPKSPAKKGKGKAADEGDAGDTTEQE